MEVLLNELAFQKVLLASIDDTVENRQAVEEEVRAEIQSLEKQIKGLKRCTTTTASNSRAPSATQLSQTPTQTQSSSLSKTSSSFTGQSRPPASAMDSYLNREPWHNLASMSSTTSTPNSADSLGYLLSPSRINLPTRKRSHSKHLEGALAPVEDNKSRRTSPSPFFTGPATPSTISSGDDEFEAFDREFLQQQKAAEERIQRERLDAEFARSIQDLSTPTMNAPATSAFDRISGVPLQRLNSATSVASSHPQIVQSRGRKLPWNTPSSQKFGTPSVKSEPSSIAPGATLAGSSSAGFGRYASMQNTSFKAKPASSRLMPGSFRDESSNASDSDIEIISPTEFHNGHFARTPIQNRNSGSSLNAYGAQQTKVKRPSFSPDRRTPGDAALRRMGQSAFIDALQKDIYDKEPVPTWMDDSAGPSSGPSLNPFGSGHQFGMTGAGGGYVYPSAYTNGMNNGIGGMRALSGSYPGRSMHNSVPDLRYTLNNVPGNFSGYGMNLTGSSQSFGSSQQASNHDELGDIIRRAGNNYNEISDYLKLDGSMANQLDYIMNDPRKTNQEIKDLLENIRPDVELPPEDREGTPEGLVYPLYEHQKLALTWLKSMEEGTNKGGILADDMGLGKTISALALILTRPPTDRARKTTLIVGPVALVRQWEKEIRTKIKVGHRLSTHMVHGQTKKLGWDDLRNYDIVLTTYGTLGAEFKRLEKFEDDQKKAGNHQYDQAPMRKHFPLLGPKSLFYRVILDEAQCIKNRVTRSARACCQLKATYRFCLTGTPMMNNVGELYSLIHFLRIKPYNEWSRFNQEFGLLTKGSTGKRDITSAMRKLQAVLKAILLRRVKTSLIDGKPIITLPEKTEEIQHVVFSEDERAFYSALESKTRIQFNKYLKANTVGKNYSNILVLLLRLRQACCHPHLIHDFEEVAPAGADLDMNAMLALAKSLSPEVVARLLSAEDAFECPVCYDATPNPRIVIPCGHDTCVECLTKISDQANQQNLADGNENGGQSKCPTCRGTLSMNKIIDYATFKKVHNPDPADGDDETASDSTGSEDSENDSEFDVDEEVDTDDDLKDFIVPDDFEETTDEEDSIKGEDGDDEAEEAEKAPKPKSKSKGKGKKEKTRGKDKKGKKEKMTEHVSIAMLKKEASRSSQGRKRYMRYLKRNWQPSAKVSKCVELLENFINDGQKTIIFSQFVSLLDLLQVPIDEKRWNCLRYDGAMSADARDAAVQKFTETQTHNIMLISLKAGNAGLNLVAASRVIILDPFWNPYIEMQAVDRAYRIGQQREVEVHRILIEDTVEDRIIELQEQKRKLVDSALDEGANKSLGRLDVRQLAFLFGVADGGN